MASRSKSSRSRVKLSHGCTNPVGRGAPLLLNLLLWKYSRRRLRHGLNARPWSEVDGDALFLPIAKADWLGAVATAQFRRQVWGWWGGGAAGLGLGQGADGFGGKNLRGDGGGCVGHLAFLGNLAFVI